MSNDDGAEPRPAAPLFGSGSEAGGPSAPMSKHEQAATTYRQLSDQAAALGAASGLPHVRHKHERAAAVWADLALAEEQRQATAVGRRQAAELRALAARDREAC